MADFPPAGMENKEDSSHFQVSFEDLSDSRQTDGGYKYTRSKYTRKPRKKLKIGFTAIPEADKLLIEAFYNEHFGGNTVFTYQSYESGRPTYLVRFTGPVGFRYSGVGITPLWDISCEIEVIEAVIEVPLPTFVGYGDSYGDMYGGGVLV